MKKNLRKGDCCLNCNHRVIKTIEHYNENEKYSEKIVFCNLDKSLDITIESNSQEATQWQSEHIVDAGDICDDFQKDAYA